MKTFILTTILGLYISVCCSQSKLDTLFLKRIEEINKDLHILPSSDLNRQLIYSMRSFFYVVVEKESMFEEYYVYYDTAVVLYDKYCYDRRDSTMRFVFDYEYWNGYIDLYSDFYRKTDYKALGDYMSFFIVLDNKGLVQAEYFLPVLTTPSPLGEVISNYLFVKYFNFMIKYTKNTPTKYFPR